MNQNNLLAFYIALSSTDTNLANDSDFKQLRNKLELLRQKSAITPQAWESIQTKMVAVLNNHESLQQLYQDTQAQLEAINITADLLPTSEELAAAQPTSRKIGTLGHHPGKLEEGKNHEIINIGLTILSNQEPQKTAQTLLQRLIDWLQNK